LGGVEVPSAGQVSPMLQVTDSGPGIPPQFRAKALERFVRLDPDRSTPGNGLGLSLVDAVAKLHEATLELGDNEPGLRVSLVFSARPATTTPEPMAGSSSSAAASAGRPPDPLVVPQSERPLER
jgi:signal transduction histidine kinase